MKRIVLTHLWQYADAYGALLVLALLVWLGGSYVFRPVDAAQTANIPAVQAPIVGLPKPDGTTICAANGVWSLCPNQNLTVKTLTANQVTLINGVAYGDGTYYVTIKGGVITFTPFTLPAGTQ